MYLSCNGNNTANTVFQDFLAAISKHGLPSRVRSDHGVENVRVAHYMFRHPSRDQVTTKELNVCGETFLWVVCTSTTPSSVSLKNQAD